jgi:hypothetical protein
MCPRLVCDRGPQLPIVDALDETSGRHENGPTFAPPHTHREETLAENDNLRLGSASLTAKLLYRVDQAGHHDRLVDRLAS